MENDFENELVLRYHTVYVGSLVLLQHYRHSS